MSAANVLSPSTFSVLSALVTALTVSPVTASDPSDPERWYADHYGPLWEHEPWEKTAQILDYYHTEIQVHAGDGEITTKQTAEWITSALELWKAEGWVSSEVPDIRTNRINETTASFTTRWLDHYAGSEDEYSCAWYLADRIDGKWKFTQYAPIDCDAHGFKAAPPG